MSYTLKTYEIYNTNNIPNTVKTYKAYNTKNMSNTVKMYHTFNNIMYILYEFHV